MNEIGFKIAELETDIDNLENVNDQLCEAIREIYALTGESPEIEEIFNRVMPRCEA
jgi:hypothetical protein